MPYPPCCASPRQRLSGVGQMQPPSSGGDIRSPSGGWRGDIRETRETAGGILSFLTGDKDVDRTNEFADKLIQAVAAGTSPAVVMTSHDFHALVCRAKQYPRYPESERYCRAQGWNLDQPLAKQKYIDHAATRLGEVEAALRGAAQATGIPATVPGTSTPVGSTPATLAIPGLGGVSPVILVAAVAAGVLLLGGRRR